MEFADGVTGLSKLFEAYSSQGFDGIVRHYGIKHYLSNSDLRELLNMRGGQLCLSKWHKFPMCYFLRVG